MSRAILGLAAAIIFVSPVLAETMAPDQRFLACAVSPGGPVLELGYARSQDVVTLGGPSDLQRQAALFDTAGFRATGSTTDGDLAFYLIFDEAGATLTMRQFTPTPEEFEDLMASNNTVAGQRRLVARFADRVADSTVSFACTDKEG